MKKVINIFVFLVIVLLLGYKFLGEDFFSKDFSVACESTYNLESNDTSITCEVEDPDDIITDDHQLTISLVDGLGNIIEEQQLVNGANENLFNSLDFNSEYDIVVDGFEIVDENYIEKEYYSYSFSTVYENLAIPSVLLSNIIVEDIYTTFTLAITDVQNTVNAITITAKHEGNTDKEIILTDFTNLDITLDSLAPLTSYNIEITANFNINDFDTHTAVLHSYETTTLKTPEIPTASISILSNDNVSLVVGVTLLNKDATSVSYTISLIDSLDNLLESEVLLSNTVEFDISGITTDYRIIIESNYSIKGINYTDIALAEYVISTNVYSNFFTIPSLHIVDTSVPITNYADYDDYLYTYFNNGESEFRINCAGSVDCEDLVNLEPYSNMPFDVIGMVHSFYDTKNIGYSFTDSYIDITVENIYSPAQILELQGEIDDILNTIITGSMTTNEQIKAVHDYVVNNSVYDEECFNNPATCDNDHNAYGVLFDNNAVCEGYSHAVDILLRALRIPSLRISSETHQWNGVFIDGEWLHLDATWDDPVIPGGASVLIYDYYLIDTITLHSNDTTSTHIFELTYFGFIE